MRPFYVLMTYPKYMRNRFLVIFGFMGVKYFKVGPRHTKWQKIENSNLKILNQKTFEVKVPSVKSAMLPI